MELLDLDRERTAWQGLLALTKPLVATGIKSAVKTLQILSGEESILGRLDPTTLFHPSSRKILGQGTESNPNNRSVPAVRPGVPLRGLPAPPDGERRFSRHGKLTAV